MKNQSNKKDLTITRIFDAPQELTFKTWIDAKLMQRWWGPRGVTNTACDIVAEPNGAMHIVMLAGEELGELKGQKWPMKGVYKKIKMPDQLVFASTALEDEKGNPNLESLVSVGFEKMDHKTKITLHVVVTKATPKADEAINGMETGWSQSLDKLAELLTRIQEGMK